MITDWLGQNGDPEIELFIEKNLAITEKVYAELQKKGWSQSYFAQKILGKKPSEISKWLNGMHNLTLKSIIKMEVALGTDLIYIGPVKEYEYVSLGMIDSQYMLKDKAVDYQNTSGTQEVVIAM